MNNSFRDLLDRLDDTPVTPASAAKALRKNFEFTLKEVEEITGIKEANLSALENGRIEMTSQYAEKLAAFYGIHPTVLLYPTGYKKESRELMEISTKAQAIIERRRSAV